MVEEEQRIPSVSKLGLEHLTVVIHVLDVLLALSLHLGLQLSVGGVLVGDGGHCMCVVVEFWLEV